MKRLLLALVAVGVLVAPAAAEARQLKPEERSWAVEIAEEYWNDRGYYAEDEGCWRVRTKVGWRDPRGGTMNEWGILAYWGGWDHCRLVLNGGWDWSYRGKRDPWWQMCSTVIHEFGHLVGWRSGSGNEHSSNPNSVMAGSVDLNRYSWWWPYFPACAEE
jgi:hypothetical protein